MDLANNMARDTIEQAQTENDSELHRLFSPITAEAVRAGNWITVGLVECYNDKALNALFLPGMLQLPQLVSMMVSDMTGYEYMILRGLFPEASKSHETTAIEINAFWSTRDYRPSNRPGHWKMDARWRQWKKRGAELISTWWESPQWPEEDILEFSPSGTPPKALTEQELAYDPKNRIWHYGARDIYHDLYNQQNTGAGPALYLTRDSVYWTDVDYFFTSKAPGITASIAAKDPNGDILVVAYDLLLGDLSAFTMELRPTPNGKVFVFLDSGEVIGLPYDEAFQHPEQIEQAILTPVDSIGLPELRESVRQWRAQEADYRSPLRFKSAGEAWWSGIQPFAISQTQTIWVGVVMPESDLLGSAGQEQAVILFLGLAALLPAMVIAWILSRRLTNPIVQLTQAADQMASGSMSVQLPSTGIGEVQSLARTFDIMRQELRKRLKSIQESESIFRAMAENSPLAIVISRGRKEKVEYINPKFVELFGYTKEDIPDFSHWWPLAYADEVYRKELKKEWSEKVKIAIDAQAAIEPVEAVVTCKKGMQRHILWGFIGLGEKNYIYGLDLTEHKEAEEKIKNNLAEKETLLRELYHRTKNNMQVIISMLRLQEGSIRNKQALSILHDLQNRIHSMALVHQMLYQSQNLSMVELNDYIIHLVDLLLNSKQIKADQIQIEYDLQPISVLFDIAIPCGLVINELVSNALKYAFPDQRPGILSISLYRVSDDELKLVFSDNGVGLPESFDPYTTETMGLSLVNFSVKAQLNGYIEYNNSAGLTCNVHIKDRGYQKRVY